MGQDLLSMQFYYDKMKTIDIYEFPGRTMTLERPFEREQALSGEITHMAIKALETVTGTDLRFYCSDVWIAAFDPEYLFPLTEIIEDDSTFLFRKKDTGELIDCDLFWKGQQTVFLEEVEGKFLENAVEKILKDRAASSNDEVVLLWKSIGFRGVRARIRGAGDEALRIRWMNSELDYATEKEGADRFVYGPLSGSSIPAPLTISLENDGAFLSMRITSYWSYWTDDSLEGTRVLGSAVKQLLDDGWKIRST
jgi:hypothetical protein